MRDDEHVSVRYRPGPGRGDFLVTCSCERLRMDCSEAEVGQLALIHFTVPSDDEAIEAAKV